MKFHPLCELFPLIEGEEFDALCEDVQQHGLLEPITTYDGAIIDGRNRYRACKKTGIEPKYTEWNGKGSLLGFVVSKNIRRRHMNSGQLAFLTVECEKIIANEIKEKEKERLKEPRNTNKNQKQTCEKIHKSRDALKEAAELTGTNRHYVADAKKILKDNPEEAKKVMSGEKTLSEAKHEIKQEEKRKRYEEKRKEKAIPADAKPDWKLITGDIADYKKHFQPESAEWIITDPPYPKEYIPLFKTLAEFSDYILKPGGSLICMTGQSYLPDYINLLSSKLNYQWTLAYMLPGGTLTVHARAVNNGWKPLLWFVKGKYQGNMVFDVCRSEASDKRFHEWGQSESGMADIIEKFTKPGEIIVDPFCGGGATGIAAIKMARKFVGLDIDAKSITVARERLEQCL